MKTEVIFYYDMDGVLCEWFGSAAQLHGRTPEIIQYHRENWPPKAAHSEDVLGIPTSDFWKKIEEKGFDFWANLEELKGARQIWDHSLALGAQRKILSCPSIDPHSLSGKSEWMKRFTGDRGFRTMHLTPDKFDVAQFGRILIDDHDGNIDAFEAHGGHGILYPQPWNSNRDKQHVAVDYVLGEMTSLASFLGQIEVEVHVTEGQLGSG